MTCALFLSSTDVAKYNRIKLTNLDVKKSKVNRMAVKSNPLQKILAEDSIASHFNESFASPVTQFNLMNHANSSKVKPCSPLSKAQLENEQMFLKRKTSRDNDEYLEVKSLAKHFHFAFMAQL